MNDNTCDEEILNSLFLLSKKVEKISDPPERVILANQELANLLEISTRTLQSWRDKGLIGFSKVGSSIFYRLSDVLSMLEAHYRKPFA